MDRKEWEIQAKIALVQKDISQKELAERLEISRQFLNNILNGNQMSPVTETIKRISRELGIEAPAE